MFWSRSHILTSFQGLASKWQRELSKLSALQAPSNLAGSFGRVLAAGRAVGSDMNAIISATRTRSRAAGSHAVGAIVNDLFAARSADAALEHKLGLG